MSETTRDNSSNYDVPRVPEAVLPELQALMESQPRVMRFMTEDEWTQKFWDAKSEATIHRILYPAPEPPEASPEVLVELDEIFRQADKTSRATRKAALFLIFSEAIDDTSQQIDLRDIGLL